MDHTLALFTLGVFARPADDPSNDEFHTRNDPIMAAVSAAQGYVAHSGYPDEDGPEVWGDFVFPHFYQEKGDGWTPQTLSLWKDLESAMAFAYHGLHADALRLGSKWLQPPQWPPYVVWWVANTRTPCWQEACDKHLLLHEAGVSPEAFTFKQPYDACGMPVELDARKIQQAAAENAARLAVVGRQR